MILRASRGPGLPQATQPLEVMVRVGERAGRQPETIGTGSWGAAIPFPGSIQMAVWTNGTGRTLWTCSWMISYPCWLSWGKLARSQTQLSTAQQHQTMKDRGSISLSLLESNCSPSWLHSLGAKVSQSPLRPSPRWRRPSAVGLPPHEESLAVLSWCLHAWDDPHKNMHMAIYLIQIFSPGGRPTTLQLPSCLLKEDKSFQYSAFSLSLSLSLPCLLGKIGFFFPL